MHFFHTGEAAIRVAIYKVVQPRRSRSVCADPDKESLLHAARFSMATLAGQPFVAIGIESELQRTEWLLRLCNSAQLQTGRLPIISVARPCRNKAIGRCWIMSATRQARCYNYAAVKNASSPSAIMLSEPVSIFRRSEPQSGRKRSPK